MARGVGEGKGLPAPWDKSQCSSVRELYRLEVKPYREPLQGYGCTESQSDNQMCVFQSPET